MTPGQRIAIMEPDRLWAELLQASLLAAGMIPLAVCGSRPELLGVMRRELPEVALVDVSAGRPSASPEEGWQAIRDARDVHPALRVVVLASSPDHIDRAWREGASGYLDKSSAGVEPLVAALRAVTAGEKCFPVPMSLAELTSMYQPPVDNVLRGITDREREVLRYVAAGADNLKIAALLGISERTVRAHVSSLYRKLGPENRAQLALLARRLGVVPAAEV